MFLDLLNSIGQNIRCDNADLTTGFSFDFALFSSSSGHNSTHGYYIPPNVTNYQEFLSQDTTHNNNSMVEPMTQLSLSSELNHIEEHLASSSEDLLQSSLYAFSPSNSIDLDMHSVDDRSPQSITMGVPSPSFSSSTASVPSSSTQRNRVFCNICLRDFGRKQELDRHQLTIHSTERRFGCDFCHKKFSRNDSLKRHKKSGRCRKHRL